MQMNEWLLLSLVVFRDSAGAVAARTVVILDNRNRTIWIEQLSLTGDVRDRYVLIANQISSCYKPALSLPIVREQARFAPSPSDVAVCRNLLRKRWIYI